MEKLTRTNDIKRVRQIGKSFPHPLVVLIIAPNDLYKLRYCISVGRSVGNAVKRNRAKRLIRESLITLHHRNMSNTLSNSAWDILLIARRPILKVKCQDVHSTLQSLFFQANLIYTKDVEY